MRRRGRSSLRKQYESAVRKLARKNVGRQAIPRIRNRRKQRQRHSTTQQKYALNFPSISTQATDRGHEDMSITSIVPSKIIRCAPDLESTCSKTAVTSCDNSSDQSADLRHGSVPHGTSCLVCFDSLTAENYCEYKGSLTGAKWRPSLFCMVCVRRIMDTQWTNFVDRLNREECTSARRRLLCGDPPVFIHNESGLPIDKGKDGPIHSLWFMASDKVVSARLKGVPEDAHLHQWWQSVKTVTLEWNRQKMYSWRRKQHRRVTQTLHPGPKQILSSLTSSNSTIIGKHKKCFTDDDFNLSRLHVSPPRRLRRAGRQRTHSAKTLARSSVDKSMPKKNVRLRPGMIKVFDKMRRRAESKQLERRQIRKKKSLQDLFAKALS